jgi:hypothetical protein
VRARLVRSGGFFLTALLVSCGAMLAGPSLTAASATAASITVTPSTGLADGSSVTVSGTGFSGAGAITECSNAAGQPTISVAGKAVPVSCSSPFGSLVTFTGGSLAATSFTVHTGTVGPPTSGTDSAGNDAAADAAKYPCPVTSAQASAGASCYIGVGDAVGDVAQQDISFGSTSTPTPSPSQTSSTPTPSPSPTSTSSAGGRSISVNPATGLVNGQKVTVTGSGFPHHDALAVLECSPGANGGANAESYCDVAGLVEVTTDGNGAFSTKLTVATGVIGSVPDAICPPASGACFIAASELSTTSKVRAQVSISFAASASPTPTPTPSSSVSSASPGSGSGSSNSGSGSKSGSASSNDSSADSAASADTLPFTGTGASTWVLVAIGLFVLDIGYLLMSATRPPRRRRSF